MPSDQQQNQDTILRNIRLITTPYNTFIFLIIPILAAAYLTFTVKHLRPDNVGFVASRRLFVFAFAIIPVLVIAIALWRADKIKAELQRQGYVQRRTRVREIDFAINVVVLAALIYWCFREESGLTARLTTGLCAFMVWWLLFLMSLGPVVYFTVRVR